MLQRLTTRLLLITLAIAATAHAGSANSLSNSKEGAASASPVTITYARVADLKSDEGRRGTIYLSFRDNASVAATEVRFALRHGQVTTEVRDTGLFSPNVRIDHRFTSQEAQLGVGSSVTRATVEYVHFVDGTTWSTDRRAEERQAQL